MGICGSRHGHLAALVWVLLLASACGADGVPSGETDSGAPARSEQGGASGATSGTTSGDPRGGDAAVVPREDGAAPAAEDAEVHAAMATHFDGMGTPGGCGVPPALVDSQDYVALDVEYTPYPQSYTMDARPITDPRLLGMFANGLNCGRWIEVTIGEWCTGSNGGADGRDFCANGQWVADDSSGATLHMLVADSCQDPNGWCRDDRYHLDLNTPSLQHFQRGGVSVGAALAAKWNNRKITWHFERAPSYSGDVKISFVPSAQKYWPAVVITNLQSGLHRVERNIQGTWRPMPMLKDNGQVYVLASSPIQTGEKPPYQIRLYDAADEPIHGGRVYSFDLPCSGTCATYTPVTYTASP
jgi:hypothetical protein